MSAIRPLSGRGLALTDQSPMPEYLSEHFQRAGQSELLDTDRYVCLAIAENKLMWYQLKEQLNKVRDVPERSIGYDDMIGSEMFRKTVAEFGSRHIWGRDVDPGQIITLAGAGSILETLFYVLADPGDGILVPTPSYAGFWADIETRDELHIVPVHTRSADDFTLTVDLLQTAYDTATIPVRALLLTNPANPMGRIHADDEIRQVVRWARSVNLHIVMNEVYALSTHGDVPFVPSGSIIDPLDDDIHFVWAFSKDFAMSGLRCGVLTTSNDDVYKSISELAYWSAVSGDTQHLLDTMLRDEAWVERYLSEVHASLADSYTRTTGALTAAGIPFYHAGAGLFVLCDFRGYLEEPTWESEHALWRRILDEANVNLTPGSACRIGEPGFMRLCFAQEPADAVATAIGRIATVV